MIYQNIIYIDALIIINLYVNFFIIKACGVFMHRKTGTKRCILAAVAGGFASLVILLPALPAPLNAIIKLSIGAVLVLIAFGYGSFREFLKNALVFLIVNISFAGLMLLLRLFAAPLNMIYNNGVVYFDISFIALLSFTAAAYGLIRLLRYILDVKFSADKIYAIAFDYKGVSRSLSAAADSGNNLTDYITGYPVIICDKSSCEGIPVEFPDTDNYQHVKGVRILPYYTIGGSGILPVFKPDRVKIGTKEVTAMIGISKEAISHEGVNAIFNPKLLI
ncbi:MAG: sigma-E processing peptidase SpoIIGA [Oscillospiraceae bacterium]|nr:sigma-E processing peptidase SpoIIGA [Oscillospiraceae bacterium]